jgi:hypothetical protein
MSQADTYVTGQAQEKLEVLKLFINPKTLFTNGKH